MMLRLTLPPNRQAERRWISDVVLGEFLGLAYELAFDPAVTANLSADGRTLELSDAFFSGAAPPPGLPQQWNVADSGLAPTLCGPGVPVLFGAPGFRIGASGDATLALDVFGAAFFMLARHEEMQHAGRDAHGRFPAAASLAGRMDFLDRPIVDEYVEILWAALQRLWPRLQRKRRSARILVSCDVDLPFDPACASLARMGKRLVGRAWRDKSLAALPATLGNYYAVQRGNLARDPYWHRLGWIMDVNERAGNQVTFNVIPEPTDRLMDNAPGLHEPRMRALLRTIHARGHLVGFHPGYNTYQHPAAFAQSAATLRRVMDEEGVRQDALGGRQHYLRWDVATTARLWAANDMCYDSTLCYPTVAGFRTGTCHEYTMFDPLERRPLALTQRPLVVMENAVIDQANMGLGHGEAALAAMQRYRRICGQFDGDFTLLWHNSSFDDSADQAMYCDLIN